MLRVAAWVAILTYLVVDALRLQALVYLLKPAVMVILIAMALGQLRGQRAPGYGRAVVVGLLFSTVGDVLLSLPRDLFIPGLVFFLIAHLCYIAALVIARPRRMGGAEWLIGAGVAVAGGALFTAMASGMRAHGQTALLVPVAAYSLVISVMLWQALTTLRWSGALALVPRLVAPGAALFFLSDSILAWNKFVSPLPAHNFLIMATYFAAQFCFAASLA